VPIPGPVLLLIYYALMFCLALIVRWAYVRRRDGPSPKPKDLEREMRFSYSPPPDRRKRSFDCSTHR
jgi:hypothetical protein